MNKNITINKLNGLLGTIAIHLLAGIIFYTMKITAVYSHEIQVKVETPESIRQEQEEAIRKKQELREQILKMQHKIDAMIAAQQRRNIGVNMSDNKLAATEKDLMETQQEIENAKKQIQSVQENLDKTREIKIVTSADGENVNNQTKNRKIEGKLAVYKGPTNIYYNLLNRRTIDLYVPVYKCPGLGKVVVLISVNQEGKVIDAKIDKTQSDNDPCLFDAAYDAALRSVFNADLNAPKEQKGSITYLFVSQ